MRLLKKEMRNRSRVSSVAMHGVGKCRYTDFRSHDAPS